MKKLKLNLDELKVESFETNSFMNIRKGTVQGNEQPAADTTPYCTMYCSYPFNDCGGGGGASERKPFGEFHHAPKKIYMLWRVINEK